MQLLEDYGFAPHLVHASRCKAIASARLKNDKVDAAILAQLLRADLLPEAWIAPAAGAGAAGADTAPGGAGAAAALVAPLAAAAILLPVRASWPNTNVACCWWW